ncbi:C-terminal binding protein [Microbacterium sp.]|uniref:C-terminal binding protein n=1 Tax=Microbacterium sp. TaxID=51671 RepID=UPI003A8D1EB1
MTISQQQPIPTEGRYILVAPHHFPDLNREHALAVELGVEIVAARDAEHFREALPGAAVVMVTPYVNLPADDIATIRLPAAIVRYGIGYDNIDVAAAVEAGIPVSIVPDSSSEEVASHAFAMGVALVRRLPAGDSAIRRSEWAGTIAYEAPAFRDLTVGVVGFGRIGRHVARLYEAIGAQVRAYDPFIDVDESVRSELDEALTSSDIITLHVPLSDDTKNLISRDVLARVKPGAVIVNVSRGGLIDEEALADALRECTISGAGLDTFSTEPLGATNPLRSAPNTLLTPHIAWRSNVSVGALQSGAVHRARLALTGGELIDVVVR